MAAQFNPGDFVRKFAAHHRWPIAEYSILVEGEIDQRYFTLADTLYFKENGARLLGNQVSVFPTGIGEQGGAYGLQRHFHPLRANIDMDRTPDGNAVFHAIALFDNDSEGKRGFNALTGQHLSYRPWRDVFLLHRRIPRTTRDPAQVEKLVAASNVNCRSLDCEIEDLVCLDLVKVYGEANPRAFFRPTLVVDADIRVSVSKGEKGRFCSYVEQNALLSDINALVDVLKALRYFMGLDPDGDR